MAWWNTLPVVGGLAGSIFGNPEQEAQQKAMSDASAAMMRYRPDAMNAHMNAFGSMQHAFDPMNNLMGQMYGSGAQQNFGQTLANPFPKAMQSSMVDQAFTPQLSPGMEKDLSRMPQQIQDRARAAMANKATTDSKKAGY